MVIKNFMVILIVMILIAVLIITVRIHSDGVDGVNRAVVMVMSVGWRGRDEAIACKGKRQAKAHEAPGERHAYKLEPNCCILLNEFSLSPENRLRELPSPNRRCISHHRVGFRRRTFKRKWQPYGAASRQCPAEIFIYRGPIAWSSRLPFAAVLRVSSSITDHR